MARIPLQRAVPLVWRRVGGVSTKSGCCAAPRGFNLCGSGHRGAVQPSLRTRLRWRLHELRDTDDAKVIAGLLLILALTFGGFLAARTVARASADPRAATR